VPGYQPPQQLVNFERALSMHPNAIIYVATGRELTRSVAYLAEIMHKGIDIPYLPLQNIVAKAGVEKGTSEADAKRRLGPYAAEILSFVYSHLAENSRARAIQAIWVFLPQLQGGSWQEETDAAVKTAEVAGFTIIRLDEVFKDKDVTKIRLAEWDDHPNAFGHRLIADELFERIHRDRARIFSMSASAN
jgi:hypothetical protein